MADDRERLPEPKIQEPRHRCVTCAALFRPTQSLIHELVRQSTYTAVRNAANRFGIIKAASFGGFLFRCGDQWREACGVTEALCPDGLMRSAGLPFRPASTATTSPAPAKGAAFLQLQAIDLRQCCRRSPEMDREALRHKDK